MPGAHSRSTPRWAVVVAVAAEFVEEDFLAGERARVSGRKDTDNLAASAFC
jgi:hypothetical protein